MIEIRVSGFECDPGEIEVGAAGSYGMQQLHFAFSAEWEGLNKRTTWNTDSGPVSVMLDENEVAEVPAEATATAGRRYFSIDGFAEGRQHISVRVTYKVFETVAPGGANSVPPTDSEMTQALAIMQQIRDLKTPEVTVGQTKTVAAAQPARVVNTGTDTKAVFDFEIPRGESGVYVGSDEPGEDVQLWIVPEGENEIDEGLDVLESTIKRVENATVFAPKIGADGTWLVYDSAKGAYVDTGVSARGTQGEKGEDGNPGQDGVSPTVSVATISGGHRVSITDVNGTQTFDVMDGEDGDGSGDGTSGADGVTFYPSVAEDGTLSWTNDGGLTNPDPVNIKGADGEDGQDGAPGADGEDGTRGAIYHKVTTAPTSYTTAIGDYTPKYRILIDTALSQSGQADMIVGDVIRQSYYDYFVDYIADGYAYISTSRISVRGATGADGDAGYTPVKGTDYWTDADKAEMVEDVVAEMGDVAAADHTHTAAEVGARASTWVPTQNDVTISAATDYTTNRVRGIVLAQDTAVSVPNGCICGVYTVS